MTPHIDDVNCKNQHVVLFSALSLFKNENENQYDSDRHWRKKKTELKMKTRFIVSFFGKQMKYFDLRYSKCNFGRRWTSRECPAGDFSYKHNVSSASWLLTPVCGVAKLEVSSWCSCHLQKAQMPRHLSKSLSSDYLSKVGYGNSIKPHCIESRWRHAICKKSKCLASGLLVEAWQFLPGHKASLIILEVWKRIAVLFTIKKFGTT